MKKQYSENEVLAALNRKNDISINFSTKTIYHLIGEKAQNDCGNGTWGKIDYLVHHLNYSLVHVSEF